MLIFPMFTRPKKPVLFTSRDELCTLLTRHAVPWETWSDGLIDNLWKEICDQDTLITVEKLSYLEEVAIFRHIRTVTLRILYKSKDSGLLFLAEFKIKDGIRVPRTYRGSSLSEKMHWGVRAGAEELAPSAIIRGLREELGVRVLPKDISDKSLRRLLLTSDSQSWATRDKIVDDLHIFFPDQVAVCRAANVELDIRWSGESKYKGIVVHNQVMHFTWHMPGRYYRPEGYVDPQTRYFSEWVVPKSWESIG